jgi:hypothetical protein
VPEPAVPADAVAVEELDESSVVVVVELEDELVVAAPELDLPGRLITPCETITPGPPVRATTASSPSPVSPEPPVEAEPVPLGLPEPEVPEPSLCALLPIIGIVIYAGSPAGDGQGDRVGSWCGAAEHEAPSAVPVFWTKSARFAPGGEVSVCRGVVGTRPNPKRNSADLIASPFPSPVFGLQNNSWHDALLRSNTLEGWHSGWDAVRSHETALKARWTELASQCGPLSSSSPTNSPAVALKSGSGPAMSAEKTRIPLRSSCTQASFKGITVPSLERQTVVAGAQPFAIS